MRRYILVNLDKPLKKIYFLFIPKIYIFHFGGINFLYYIAGHF
jgi:hypothetical protein